MATNEHRLKLAEEQNNANSLYIEQRKPLDVHQYQFALSGIRETIGSLPIEQTLNLDASKIYRQLIDAFHTYESHQPNFVFDRDMHYVIHSLGFVPVD